MSQNRTMLKIKQLNKTSSQETSRYETSVIELKRAFDQDELFFNFDRKSTMTVILIRNYNCE